MTPVAPMQGTAHAAVRSMSRRNEASHREHTSTAARIDPGATGVASVRWLTPGRFALVIAALVFVAFPSVVLGWRTFVFRDFSLFSYPVAHFARESFWRGEVPLWDPLNYCGIPFLAQWNTMVLYPPALFYLVLPLSWALPVFCLLHLLWGSLGMYLLARRWTDNPVAAGLAGTLFAFNGLNLNFLMWPSHVATFSWLPWVLWLGPEGCRRGGRWWLAAVLAAALQFLAGGPETIVMTWALVGWLLMVDLFGAAKSWPSERLAQVPPAPHGSGAGCRRRREESFVAAVLPARTPHVVPYSPHEAPGRGDARPTRLTILLRCGALVGLAGLLCAAQLLPFLQLLAHSQRDSNYSGTTHDWSMPVWGWANFLVPLFRTNPTAQGVFLQNGQYWTSSYYVGIGTIWLACVGVWRSRERRVRLLGLITLIALSLACGETSILFSALHACLPALGFMRYPVKFVTIAVALLPLLAAYGLASLLTKGRRLGRFEWSTAAAMLLLVAGIVVLERNAPAEVWRVTWQNALSRAGFLVAEVSLIALLVRQSAGGWGWLARRTMTSVLVCALLIGTFYLDLLTHVPNQNPTVPRGIYAAKSASGAAPAGYRAMVSPGALRKLKGSWLADPVQNFVRNRQAAWSDVNLLDGTAEVDGFFSLVPKEAWAVTELANSHSERDLSSLLDFLAVSRVSQTNDPGAWNERATALPLVTIGQEPIFENAQASLHTLGTTNVDLRRQVLLPPEARGAITANAAPEAKAKALMLGNQSVAFMTESTNRAVAVISETWFPGWAAYVDGHPAKLWRANYAFQALEVPAGKHQVHLVYRDTALLVGAACSGLGVACWLALWVLMPRFRGQERLAV